MKDLSGWGRYPRLFGPLTTALTAASAARLTAAAPGVVARGLGRAYGDAAIGRDRTLAPAGLDRLQGFDPDTGLLRAEAAVSLDDILTTFVPRGFFPPVVPGTRFVTVGGMIASDVHGKNQHNDGTFGEHVEAFTLALPDGRTVRCARDQNTDLFHATIGGMGLTGTILDASFRLRRVDTGWIRQTTSVANNLSDAIGLLSRTSGATYTVAWIDVLARGAALGRSLILEGGHAARDELGPRQAPFPPARAGRVSVPFDMPSGLLNAKTVSAFNALYYRKGALRAGQTSLVPWDSYFFPLDGIARWNRIYGPRGFVQHQCVIPEERAEAVLSIILERLSQTGTGSFLAVLKRLRAGTGLMSFPMDGLTLALDIPVSERGLALLAEIDGLVSEAGGRLYLAKDACQSRETFEAGYPNIAAFHEVRRDAGALGHMSSKQSERLGL